MPLEIHTFTAKKEENMMDRVFHARITAGQYLFLLLPTALVIYGFLTRNWFISLLCMLLLVLVIEELIHTTYTLTADGQLLIGRGRFHRQKSYALADITEVERAKAMMLGRLAVTHYVLLRFSNGKCEALLPTDEEGFVQALMKRRKGADKEEEE